MNEALEAAIRRKLSAFTAELVELYRAALEDALSTVVGRRFVDGEPGPSDARRSFRGRGKGIQRLVVGPSSVTSVDLGTSPRRGRARTVRQRRSQAQLDALAAQIEAYVSAHPGSTSEQIKRALSIPKKEWARPIGRLLEAGRVKTTGVRRSTRYFPAG
jgi:hypothetical protein